MKKSYLLKLNGFVFLFLIALTGFSQTLSGTVIDGETQETIPFVNVIIGTSYGVITNDEGQFNIAIDRFQATDSLIFSFMGYARHAVAIKDVDQQPIFLIPTIDSLDEVYLIDRNLDPLTILEKVNENISKNHAEQSQKWTVFERSKTSSNVKDLDFKISKAGFIDKKTLKELNKDLKSSSQQSKNHTSNIYLDTYYDLYKNSGNDVKISFKKGTKLINRDQNTSMENIQSRAIMKIAEKLQSPNSFKVRSGIIPVGDSIKISSMFVSTKDSLNLKIKEKGLSKTLNEFSFGKDSDFDFITDYKKYKYTITKAFSYLDEMTYVIEFEPIRSSANYTGELYVSADTYAIQKLKYKIADGKKGDKVNLKLLLGLKYEQLEKEVMVIFHKSSAGVYSPKYIKTQTRDYTYFDRSLSFIENVPRKERMKLKLGILLEGIVTQEDEILIIDAEGISESKFSNIAQDENVLVETISKYDPEIWAQYNIISPNQAIKDFEN